MKYLTTITFKFLVFENSWTGGFQRMFGQWEKKLFPLLSIGFDHFQ